MRTGNLTARTLPLSGIALSLGGNGLSLSGNALRLRGSGLSDSDLPMSAAGTAFDVCWDDGAICWDEIAAQRDGRLRPAVKSALFAGQPKSVLAWRAKKGTHLPAKGRPCPMIYAGRPGRSGHSAVRQDRAIWWRSHNRPVPDDSGDMLNFRECGHRESRFLALIGSRLQRKILQLHGGVFL